MENISKLNNSLVSKYTELIKKTETLNPNFLVYKFNIQREKVSTHNLSQIKDFKLLDEENNEIYFKDLILESKYIVVQYLNNKIK